MSDRPTLYTCDVDDGGARLHPCRRAHDALRDANVDYETVVFDSNKPFGWGSKGKRPELKRISGQEKLPVLKLADGSTVNGSGKIVKWANEQAGA
jgi:glutathione S-transferase